MALTIELGQARGLLMKQAGGAIDALAAIATDLAMKESATSLKEVHERLRADTFDLMMVGRFKNGKSTLLNALLGRLTHPVAELQNGQGPLPVDDLPCTATLTRIQYADKPYVRTWGFNEKYKEWSLAQYLRDSTVRTDEAETKKFFHDIREFELGLPAELCQAGVALIDSPGTDEDPGRTAITRDAVKHCDAAIVVFRSDALAGETELKFLSEILSGGTRVFTVANLMHNKLVDERFKGYVWNHLVKDLRGGSVYTKQDVQDFTAQDIYLVDALKAKNGKLTANAQLVVESGLDLLEQRLAKFLLNDRQRIHLGKFLHRAEVLATSMEQMIGERRDALQADEKQLQQAYKAIQPQLATIHARRDKLPKLFERYRGECERELKVSFEQMIAQLRQDLPEELKRRPLPFMESTGIMESVGKKIIAPFRQKKIGKEALEICNAIIVERVRAWAENPPESPGAQQVLKPIFDRLFEEVRSEVAVIDGTLNQIHLQLTGWTLKPEDGPRNVIGLQERIISGAVGMLLVGDFSPILGAGGTGYRGVAGNFAGQVAAAIALSLLGMAGGALFIPLVALAGIISNIFWGGSGLEDRVKTSVQEEADKGLQTVPAKGGSELDQEVARILSQVEMNVIKEVGAVIEAQEQNIREMMELNKRNQVEKAQSLVVLDDASRKVAAQRQALKEAMVQVEQTS